MKTKTENAIHFPKVVEGRELNGKKLAKLFC